ncbi:GerMN domain-containing protein [Mangrovibacillus cuniculi]|uniref:Sporulation protein n=1 Tax=Mangrovibacillus cuniculi TaxID=2593652 RepID=A0A7S8HFP9_9BACI|nr:GerMN domain-containing protein [Mangrovibacillus cuniculi]QPC47149.1 sporulation protein [Mangrovibacillus cuniculi]
MSKKRQVAVVSVLASSVYLAGCGLFESNEAIDPPQTVSYLEDGEAVETTGEEANPTSSISTEAPEGSVRTDLFLISADGYVVPQSFDLPEGENAAQQALDYLVDGGPITNLLPNGYRAVLPADTEVTVKMDGETAVVDFSNEFATYAPEDEQHILQSITWTLTQFDGVKNVKLSLNGEELTEMPVDGTPIAANGTSRGMGINLLASDLVDITNTKPVVVYYLTQTAGGYDYVPVTTRISSESTNASTEIVQELIEGPAFTSSLVSDFMPGVALVSEPTIADGTLTLNFNEGILMNMEDRIVSSHTLNALTLSLTEQPGIERITIQVNGEMVEATDDGTSLISPVTRPENVNTGSY